MGGPGFSVFAPNANYVRVYNPKAEFGPTEWRRMIYMTKVRIAQDATFGAFDCPDAGQSQPKRPRSTTPLQALNLLNSAFVLQQAEFFARQASERSRRRRCEARCARVSAGPAARSRCTRRHRSRESLVREHGLPRSAGPCSTRTSSCSCRDETIRPIAFRTVADRATAAVASRPASGDAASGLAGIALASLLGVAVAGRRRRSARTFCPSVRCGPRQPHFAPKAQAACWSSSVPARCSHLDTFDYKPELMRDGQPMPGSREARHVPGRERQPRPAAVGIPAARPDAAR